VRVCLCVRVCVCVCLIVSCERAWLKVAPKKAALALWGTRHVYWFMWF